MRKIFFILVALIILAGCAEKQNPINIQQYLTDEDGIYRIVAFLDHDIENTREHLNKELPSKITFTRLTVIDVNQSEGASLAKNMSLKQFPAYVLLDNKGIILETNEYDELLGKIAELSSN